MPTYMNEIESITERIKLFSHNKREKFVFERRDIYTFLNRDAITYRLL